MSSGGERCRFLQGCVVGGFGFSRRDMADRLQKPAVVEPVDPFERGVLDRLQRSPRPAPMDHLGFVEPVDRLGECVVVAVADAADDGTRPASANRSVYLIETYWTPRSE